MDGDKVVPSASARRRDSLRVLLSRWLVLAGLGGLAVVQPLLDLFGSNPEFFVFKRSGVAEIIAFALLVGIGLPLLLLVPETLAWATARHRVQVVVHSGLVGLLGGLYGLVLARQLASGSDLVALGAFTLLGVAAALAEARLAAAALVARYLALGPIVFVALFLGASPTARLLWGGEAEALDVEIGNPVPVVVLLLDELPLASLMTADGELDVDRFPGFASLATQSTWFRNASANASATTVSVPASLTGVLPELDSIPISIDHPNNLFTVLGNAYAMEVHESVTALCPSDLCRSSEGDQAVALQESSLRSILLDAWVVGRHLALPPTMREDLPALDAAWGGFLGQDIDEASDPLDGSAASAPDPVAAFLEGAPEGRAAIEQGEQISELATRAEPRPDPTLWFTHVVLPHQPWELTPSATRYSWSADMAGVRDSRWAADERVVIQGYQRHLLQVGYTDRLIGDLVESLQASGLWDEAAVVVYADHGIAFNAGDFLRRPSTETVDELYRVPLFVHLPGQSAAMVDDRDAMLVDIFPTMLDILDIDTDWRLDGRSLLLDDPPHRDRPVRHAYGPRTIEQGTTGLMGIVERNTRWVDPGSWPAVAAVGELREHVGAPLGDYEVDARGVQWSLEQSAVLGALDPDSGFLPVMLTGTTDGSALPEWFLVSLNGTIAGTGFALGDAFSAILDEERFVRGANDVVVLVPDGAGGWWSPELPVAGVSDLVLEGGGDGTLTLGDGPELPVVRADDDNLVRIDRAVLRGDVLSIGGWSLSEAPIAVPNRVVIVADGELLTSSERRAPRVDLARRYDNPIFERSGFELVATRVDHEPESLAVLAIYDDVAIWRPVTLYDPEAAERTEAAP